VCWGFEVKDFEKKIGVKEEFAEALLRRLLAEEKSGMIETTLSAAEVAIVRRALLEVEKKIEEWEFQTRMGTTLNQVKEIPIFKYKPHP